MKIFRLFWVLAFAPCCLLKAQTARLNSFEKIVKVESPIDDIQFRNIGPTVMSGRVTDLEVNPENPLEFYVAYASGGLWHTMNNGQSFKPLFDNEATLTIGDIAVNWKSRTIWVGSGEVNSSRSSYAGLGIYKSNDSGKSWKHCGLEESHHIGRIVLHPSNPDIAWVAVLGHLYTANAERGIYKTTDGGRTWEQTLFINDSTGCVDLVADAINYNVLYASAWTRTRKAWHFNGTGNETAIYKSTDGGIEWKKITTEASGFPQGNKIGRIGISVHDKNPQVLYALVDNNNNQPEKNKSEQAEKKLSARELATMSGADFLNLDEKKLENYLKQNGYPEKYSVESLKNSVRKNEWTVKEIAEWKLADADANLFDTPIYGAELYRSHDGGAHWFKTHQEAISGFYFTYGYYFGTVQVSPVNPDKVLIGGYPILLSEDGGKSFRQIDGDNCHPDYHRIWINPKDDRHLITGNDGGVNITYDNGQNWFKANNPAVGQFYAIQVDNAKPYNVYGGLQDNGTWVGPSNSTESTGWHQSGRYEYKNIGGGDGMQVQVDTRNNDICYYGYQFGNYFRLNLKSEKESEIKPVHDIGQKPFRFNWQTPICLSRHNQDILYFGSNCFHRSMNKGDNLETLSDDLTYSANRGNVPFATLTTIAESPKKFGLIYIGTDDGRVQISKDGGYSWNTIMDGQWVSRIEPGKFVEGRVYVSFNGYRDDDFKPYLYVSENYGKNWKQIGKDLPLEPINVIREDRKNGNILYVGTDNGLYVSFNRGIDFIPWHGGLPRVAIHDIAIQERENEIVLGTHGRSIYIAKLDRIQKFADAMGSEWVLFDIAGIRYRSNLGNKSFSYLETAKQNVPIYFYAGKATNYTLHIESTEGTRLYSSALAAKYGINHFDYDLSINTGVQKLKGISLEKRDNGQFYIPAGKYIAVLENNDGNRKTASFELTESD